MTKRLTITLVALVLFVLIAVLPVSAILANPATGRFNGSVIMNGTPPATVFIGESGLNLTPVLSGGVYTAASIPTYYIGWWAPGSQSFPNNPPVTVNTGPSFTNFEVTSGAFGPYPGNWYCLTAAGTSAISNGGVAPFGVAFVVADPAQTIQVWDVQANQGNGQDMTGKSVVRGSLLTFRIDTNLAAFTQPGRGNQRLFDPSSWNNGTALINQLPSSNVWVSTTPFINGGFTNGTTPVPAAPTGVAATDLLTYVNWSNNLGNVAGTVNYTRTWTFNNTICTGSASACFGLNFTTAAGNVAPTIPAGVTQTSAGVPATFNANPNALVDGFINFRVRDEAGQVITRVYRPTGAVVSLSNAWVNLQPWFLGGTAAGAFTGSNGLDPATTLVWDTLAIDPGLGTPAYPAGTYTVWSETTLSNMKNNYKLGTADYGGKTISLSGTVTLVSDTVKIEANKETVVRSKPFSVTITGRPLATYQVWVKGTSSMTGGYNNQPPMVSLWQSQIYNDTPQGPYTIGGWQYQNGLGRTIRLDTCTDAGTGAPPYRQTRYYVLINTSSSGTRTVDFVTTNATKAQTYTIRVEGNTTLFDYTGDEVDVKVEKGAVTITAAGDQSYYLGEEIKFSGTNTETATTYLFITGPNLHSSGSRLNDPLMDPRRTSATLRTDTGASDSAVANNNPITFIQRDVNADNTWDWKWGTANWALDAGTYTIYAVSGPKWATDLGNVAYGTVSIIVKKPFVSATASQSTVAQQDKLFITGTAEGKPQLGVAIWVLGKNYATRVSQSVNSDASFSYEITRAITGTNMDAGQYFVVVQHPMQNQIFDINMCDGTGTVTTTGPNVCNFQQGTGVVAPQIFTITGAGSLQGTDAAEALVQGINTANVDDTYTKLVFLVEVPSIRIDPIGDRHVGDKFTITATTNLAVDDEVLFEVYSSSFKPTQKSQSGEFSGASGTVKVTKGDTGLNKISFDVDASTFKPDEYIVSAKWILRQATSGTALFNVLEGAAPTAVPTAVVTAALTGETTAAPTEVPTATPTKTPTQPGFGALVALIGLGAVAFFVVRRH